MSTAGVAAHNESLRVVLDTNVLLSLFVFEDSRFAAMRHALEAGRWTPLTDQRCLGEFRRVLAYPIFNLDAATQATTLSAYAAHTAPIAGHCADATPLPQCRDRDDQKFLELARDGGAALLVTSDKALLKLARRGRLRQLFQIRAPDAALSLLSGDYSAMVQAGDGTGDANRHIR